MVEHARTHVGMLAGLGDYFVWWQGLLALLVIGLLIAYKVYRDKQV
ncbi:MAG: hypothetical protein U1A27_09870 [Phycisphaerae bacterium]